MRPLLLLLAVCLTGCATRLTLISPPVRPELLERCPAQIAEPLTTGDQFDLARALVQATRYGKTCAARMEALTDSVQSRDQLMQSVKEQLQ